MTTLQRRCYNFFLPLFVCFFYCSHGISTWMCTDINGGNTYREEILANIRDAKVFLIFLNEKWAKSNECVFEYNYATVSGVQILFSENLKKNSC